MAEFYSVFSEVLSRFSLEESLRVMHQHIRKKRKSADEWVNLAEKAGFQVKEVFIDGFDYGFADGTAMLDHHFIRMAFFPSWEVIVPGRQREMIFTEVRRELNLIAHHKGCLSLSVPFACYDCVRP